MTNGQAACGGCVATPPEIVTALSELYILSNSAAQRGTHGLEVRDAQWRALERGTRNAKAVLGPQPAYCETHAVGLLRRMTAKCECILDRHATSQQCPHSFWHEIGTLGREAYECIDRVSCRAQSADGEVPCRS
jgi:hypothetical protein